eukprot:SAG31_NODE_21236_length_554_cov_1.318681_1_plen_114_part_01
MIIYNRPKRLNAWSSELIDAWQTALQRVAADSSLAAAVLTGAGRYYCSGVDFGAVMTRPMLPSALIREAAARNYKLFEAFIDFPKPLVAAVNGPAIGGSRSPQFVDISARLARF